MKQFNNHNSVLLFESIEALNIVENGVYVDCTAGRGGHIDQILSQNKNNTIVVIDKDLDAISFLEEKYKHQKRVHIVHSDFKNIDTILNKLEISSVNGFLFDLGVSSPQLDNPIRGFSYKHDALLDMRMDQTQKIDAHHVVNHYSLNDLTRIFKLYGESKYALVVARAIVNERQKNQINTTYELVNIIKQAIPKSKQADKHPARVFFQAIRIEVNNELEDLDVAIKNCFKRLDSNGTIVIISFHSLEDKIVKNCFNEIINNNKLPSYIPLKNQTTTVYTKVVKPSKEETTNNNRARSAKLRILQKKGEHYDK